MLDKLRKMNKVAIKKVYKMNQAHTFEIRHDATSFCNQ